jgi:hypothetical protein
MNAHLQKALEALSNSGAQGIPSETTVENAQDGTIWNGTKTNNSPWSLTKNNETSFTVIC